jgi:hypothetical protein
LPLYPPDPTFSSHYTGATSAGLIRGGYHYAHPDLCSGSAQATYFLANGGGWTGDGRTLPGTLDIEYNPDPNGDTCYGLSKNRPWWPGCRISSTLTTTRRGATR